MSLGARKSNRAEVVLAFVLSLAGLSCTDAYEYYSSAQEAKNAAARFESQLAEKKQCIDESFRQHQKNNDQFTQLRGQAETLWSDMGKAILDLRNGSFCSLCNRTATEIESQEKIPIQKHLTNVKGVLKRASDAKIDKKKSEFLRRIETLEIKMKQLRAANQELWTKALKCHAEQEEARFEYWNAQFWIGYLKENTSVPSNAPRPLSAGQFGLSHGSRSSDYDALRAYSDTGQVQTVNPNSEILPDRVKSLRHHQGIDFSSRNSAGEVQSVPFKAGVEGTLVKLGGGSENSIAVRLPNGNTMEYLHASEVSSELKALMENNRPVIIHPDTVLGLTGGVTSGGVLPTHLHVQAFDSRKNPINPDLAHLDSKSPYFIGYQSAREKSEASMGQLPTFTWPRDQSSFDLAAELVKFGDSYLDETVNSPEIQAKRIPNR